MPIVSTITGAVKSTALKRTVNPRNDNEIIVYYDDIAIVVDKRAWNMLSVNAPIERIESAKSDLS